jgi:hypothetical protein
VVRTLDDPDLDDADRKLLHDVAEVGWHFLVIPEEAGTPGWAFSVGLYHSFRHPEVVVFGLPLKLLGQVIGGIGTAVRGGKVFAAGQDYADILEGVRCAFRPVTPCWYRPFLGYARWFYQGDDFPVLQCLWPDKQQHFPWEPKFKKAWLSAQPLLYESDMVAARAVELMRSTGDWPFPEPPNVVTITTRQVIHEGRPILLVKHEEDGEAAWQFLTGGPVQFADMMVVALGEMVKREATLTELADLPPGWRARRSAVGEPWQRIPSGGQ